MHLLCATSGLAGLATDRVMAMRNNLDCDRHVTGAICETSQSRPSEAIGW